MRITAISAYAIKAGHRYQPEGRSTPTAPLPSSDYVRHAPYPQLYSDKSEALVVRVDTDEGVSGWGESQAPIAPEVAQTIVAKVIGPAVLGRDPLATNLRFRDMFETMKVRGQIGGYQLDAIAGVDIALWDIRGKVAGQSVAELIGGRYRDELPCYVTGLRGRTQSERLDEARQWADQGVGLKPFLGFSAAEDIAEVERIRAAVGDRTPLMVDAAWRYTLADAIEAGQAFQDLHVDFLEAPLPPENVADHARLAHAIRLPIAIGEQLRTRAEFMPWFHQRALSVCQPDVMRNGITETVKIASLAESFNLPTAPHTGCSTAIGMAATWQTAAALPNLVVQEFQPVMLDLFNPWLTHPLMVRDGRLLVPAGHGLGITLDHDRFAADADSVVTIHDGDQQ